MSQEVLARVLECSDLRLAGGEETTGAADGHAGQADLLQSHAPGAAFHGIGEGPAIAGEHQVLGADMALAYPLMEVMSQVLLKGYKTYALAAFGRHHPHFAAYPDDVQP